MLNTPSHIFVSCIHPTKVTEGISAKDFILIFLVNLIEESSTFVFDKLLMFWYLWQHVMEIAMLFFWMKSFLISVALLFQFGFYLPVVPLLTGILQQLKCAFQLSCGFRKLWFMLIGWCFSHALLLLRCLDICDGSNCWVLIIDLRELGNLLSVTFIDMVISNVSLVYSIYLKEAAAKNNNCGARLDF